MRERMAAKGESLSSIAHEALGMGIPGASGEPDRQGADIVGAWAKGADLHTPSFRGENSAYKKLLRETAARPVKDVYVPPWRRTMSEVYGKEAVEAMKAEGKLSYVERANKFANEEATRRASGSKQALRATIAE